MSIPTKLWIYICSSIAAFGIGYGYGHHVAAKANAQARDTDESTRSD